MDIDEAWDAFQKSRSIKKASISEKLDTIAAQLNEIQTDSSRTAEIIPKLLGDDSAIDASNAQAPPMDPSMMMGGMGGAPPGGDMGAPPMGDGIPGAEDMGPEGMEPDLGEGMIDETEMPMDEEMPGAPVGEPSMESDMGMGMPEEPPMEALGEPPEMDMGMEGTDDTVTVLTDILHQKVDEGDMASVKALADAIEQLSGDIVAGDGLGIPMEDETIADEGLPMETDYPPMGGADFLGKSAALSDAPMVEGDSTVPEQASADGSNETVVEKVMDILTDAQMEVAAAISGDEGPAEEVEDAPEAEVEIEVETEPEDDSDSESGPEPEEEAEEESDEETEDAPEADLSEDDEAPFKESCEDKDMLDAEVSQPTFKSAMDLSFKEVLEAKMNGQDLVADFIQKSAGETDGYNEMDPWGITRRSQMFAKTEGAMGVGDSGATNPTMGEEPSNGATPTEPVLASARKSTTVADEVEDPQAKMSGKHDGTDSTTVADDIKDPMDHTKGSAPGGDLLDDVDEEKGKSDHSVNGGEPLDDVDEKKGTSDHKVGDDDLIDDVDEKKGTSDHKVGGGDLLSNLHDVRKSAADTGIHIQSMRELLSVKKTERTFGSRPDANVTANGELERPELGKVQKSLSPAPVRMGRGVDPHKVVEADWAEYNLYKAQHGL